MIVLSKDGKHYAFEVNRTIRMDVTAYFNDGMNYDNSGFEVHIDKGALQKDTYEINVIIANRNGGQYYHKLDRSFAL